MNDNIRQATTIQITDTTILYEHTHATTNTPQAHTQLEQVCLS